MPTRQINDFKAQNAAGYTVATLPATVPTGTTTFVTDATTPTFLATAVGGGAVICPVFFNGTVWVTI